MTPPTKFGNSKTHARSSFSLFAAVVVVVACTATAANTKGACAVDPRPSASEVADPPLGQPAAAASRTVGTRRELGIDTGCQLYASDDASPHAAILASLRGKGNADGEWEETFANADPAKSSLEAAMQRVLEAAHIIPTNNVDVNKEAFAPAASGGGPGIRYVTFGVIRTAYWGFDKPHETAAYFAMARSINMRPMSPTVVYDSNGNAEMVKLQFRVNVTTIPCGTYADCTNLSPADDAKYVQSFIDKMPEFAAILRPNYFITARIMEAAKAAGNIPVIDADSGRIADYQSNATNAINFVQEWQGQFDHLFTLMMHTGKCAFSGVWFRSLAGPLWEKNKAYLSGLFTTGGMSAPAFLDIDAATDAELERFVITEEPRRRCFMVLAHYDKFHEMIERLSAMPGYKPAQTAYYGLAHLGGDAYLNDGGTTDAFGEVKFLSWVPPQLVPQFSPLFQWWAATATAEELAAFDTRFERVPTRITTSAAKGFAVLQIAISAVFGVFATQPRIEWPESLTVFPLPQRLIVDFFYSEELNVADYPFHKLRRTCPPVPLPQVCFCNTLGRVSFVYQRNASSPTGTPYAVFDNPYTGQKDMTTIAYPQQCAFKVSGWSYPITVAAFFPKSLVDGFMGGGGGGGGYGGYSSSSSSSSSSSGFSGAADAGAGDLYDLYIMFQSAFGMAAHNTNFAAAKPPRPTRYLSITVPDGSTTQATVDAELDLVDPFLVYGSMEGPITRTSGVLTLLPRMMEQQIEDPPLVPHDGRWKWHNILMQPVLADYIHSLASYYADHAADFGSVHAIASTHREAELISMSFATFGFLVKEADIVVSTDPTVWGAFISDRGGAAAASRADVPPFLLVVSTQNVNEVIMSAALAAALMGAQRPAVIGFAASPTVIHHASQSIRSAVDTAGGTASFHPRTDFVFGSFRDEWWTPAALAEVDPMLRHHYKKPLFHVATLVIDFAKQLATAAEYNYRASAADILYQRTTVTAANTAFGPFYNSSCSAQEIATNARDRQCQCTKAVRSIFLHSLLDIFDDVPSARTGRFVYRMTTCGVVYKPYVPPPVLSDRHYAISTGAIVGIAVGASAFALLVIAALVFLASTNGRNNRAAPTDPSIPFAIVFTDIQSSTALWARTPNAMSAAVEQHHKLMRKAISSHSGYEVKTVGDSFMVAFKHSDDAVGFALAIQKALYDAEWSDEIDASYLELLLESGSGVGGVGLFASSPENGGEHSNEAACNDILLPDGDASSSHHIRNVTAIGGAPLMVFSGDRSVDGGNASTASSGVAMMFDPAEKTHTARRIASSAAIGQRSTAANDCRSGTPQTEGLETASGLIAVGPLSHKGSAVAFRSPISNSSAPHHSQNHHIHVVSIPPQQEIVTTTTDDEAAAKKRERRAAVKQKEQEAAAEAANAAIARFTNRKAWHGLRVRIGVHYGLGDIRKDPVTLGYDYYGTVVNTAARVEGVGHGGQTLVTEDAYNSLSESFVRRHIRGGGGGAAHHNSDRRRATHHTNGDTNSTFDSATTASASAAVVVALGKQTLRGLDDAVPLFQLVPAALAERYFPPLRLEVEKVTDDGEGIESDTSRTKDSSAAPSGNGNANNNGGGVGGDSAEELISRLCSSKHFSNISAEFALIVYHVMNTAFSPTSEKFSAASAVKLGEAWGFNVRGGGENMTAAARRRLIVALVGKISKTIVSGKKLSGISVAVTNGAANGMGGRAAGLSVVGGGGRRGDNNTDRMAASNSATNPSSHGGGGGGGGGTARGAAAADDFHYGHHHHQQQQQHLVAVASTTNTVNTSGTPRHHHHHVPLQHSSPVPTAAVAGGGGQRSVGGQQQFLRLRSLDSGTHNGGLLMDGSPTPINTGAVHSLLADGEVGSALHSSIRGAGASGTTPVPGTIGE